MPACHWMKMTAGWTVVDLTNQVGFMEKLQVRKVSFYVAHIYGSLRTSLLPWAKDMYSCGGR